MPAEPVVYGLSNCDSCRKAKRWLDRRNCSYRFHDVRADGLTAATVDRLAKASDWETLVNRRSTTWRQLDTACRESIDARSVGRILAEHPTLMKRPVLVAGNTTIVGFDAASWEEALG